MENISNFSLLYKGIEDTKNQSAWGLMLNDNSAFIISFLYSQFQEENQQREKAWISERDLVMALNTAREVLYRETGNCPISIDKSAKEYLTDWSGNGEIGPKAWLNRKSTETGISYELSINAIKAINAAMSLKSGIIQDNTFESNMHAKFEIFENMLILAVRETSVTPDDRINSIDMQIDEWKLKIKNLEDEKQQILAGSEICIDSGKCREYINNLIEMVKKFEVALPSIAIEQKKVAKDGLSKLNMIGENENIGSSIVAFKQNINNVMEQSESGKDYKYILKVFADDNHNSKLFNLLERISSREITNQFNEAVYLRNTRSRLCELMENINDVEKDIDHKVNIILDEHAHHKNKEIRGLFAEILQQCHQISTDPNMSASAESEFVFETYNILQINKNAGTFIIPFYNPKETERTTVRITPKVYNVSKDIEYLRSSKRNNLLVNSKQIRTNIESMFSKKPRFTLGELAQIYPLKYGLREFLAYVHHAMSANPECIDFENFEEILVKTKEGNMKCAKCPVIVFSKKEII